MSSLDCEKECSDILLPGGWCLVLSVPWPISPTSCDTFLKRLQEKKNVTDLADQRFLIVQCSSWETPFSKGSHSETGARNAGTGWPPGGQPRKPVGGALGHSKLIGDGICVYCISSMGLRKLSEIASGRMKERKGLLFQILYFHFNYFTPLMNNFSLSHLCLIAGWWDMIKKILLI